MTERVEPRRAVGGDELEINMALTCPACAAVIPTEDINVSTDVAMCRACGRVHKAADLVHDEVLDAVEKESADVLRGPQPPGIRWNDDGQTLMIRTGIGSRPVGAFLAAFAGFWTIAALAFVGDMVSALLAGPPPPLGPDATEAERAAREMQDRMSGASSIGDWVMAAVLTVIPVGFWMLSLTAFFASVRIRIRPDEGTVVKGFFPFYSRRSFDPARVTAVHEVLDTTTRVNGKNPAKVVIVAGEEIDFGGFMPEARRKWVAAILRANLLRRR